MAETGLDFPQELAAGLIQLVEVVAASNQPDGVAIGQSRGIGEEGLVLPNNTPAFQVMTIKTVETRDDIKPAVLGNSQLVLRRGQKLSPGFASLR